MPTVAIIGAGFSGICLAIELQRAGIDYVVLDKADGIGGVWRSNTYPGAACDVPAHMYSFSFARNPRWSKKFASQPEILAYLEGVVDDFGLRANLRLNTTVLGATFREGQWHVDTDAGELVCTYLVAATGQLSRPRIPSVPGDFGGPAFHSATWQQHDLSDANVVVVGNGASAIQIIPEVAEQAKHLSVVLRTPNWVVDKPVHTYASWEKALYATRVGRLYRWYLYWWLESRFPALTKGSSFGRYIVWQAERDLARRVPDPVLREQLRPDFAPGCKRILISNDYYPTLCRDDVDVVVGTVDRIDTSGVWVDDRHVDADVLIWATGFATVDLLGDLAINGPKGTLAEAWKDGPLAYLGMTVPDFPNLFVLYGPNTNLGHSSIVFMIECQCRYLRQLLEAADGRSVEVRPDVVAGFDREVRAAAGEMVWDDGCTNWYKTADGRITNNWPWSCTRYWWRTRSPQLDEFTFTAAPP